MGDELGKRLSKHRYDFGKRPENNELTKHLAKTPHNFETDIEVSIVARGIATVRQREMTEDKIICKLGTLHPNGLNLSLHQYGEDMYDAFQHADSATSNDYETTDDHATSP